MNKSEELRRHMRDISHEWEGRLGSHLSEEDLIGYQQGRLAETERKRVQSHLVQCDECIAAFKNVNDFFEPAREGEDPISNAEVQRERKAFRRRVRVENAAAAGAPGLRLGGFWFGLRATMALAASALLVVLFTGAWVLWLRQENQQLARRSQIEQGHLAERLRQIELENRRQQEQADTLKKNYESQLAELRRPQLNAPIYDISSRESIQRAGGDRAVTELKVPPTARQFTLILNGEGQPEYPSYGMEIVDGTGQSIWRGEGLRRGMDGNFVLILDRTFLREGKYRLKLYGQSGGRSKMVAEYLIVLTTAH